MKILFISNRFNVLEELLKNPDIRLDILVLKDSILEKILISKKIEFKSFNANQSKKVLEIISRGNFDVLISNGCPFVIPTDKRLTSRLLLNVHPTYLPNLGGKTPLNGIYYNSIDHIGATLHYITNTIDGGNIIYQERHEVTNDLDQGLIYYLSFILEGIVFKKGWEILVENNFIFEGSVQNKKEGSYFNRTIDKMVVDFKTMNTEEILRRIKSFGIKRQGCTVTNCDLDDLKIIYEATQIINPILIEKFKNHDVGTIVLEYDSKYLVKTIDGIIKISKFE